MLMRIAAALATAGALAFAWPAASATLVEEGTLPEGGLSLSYPTYALGGSFTYIIEIEGGTISDALVDRWTKLTYFDYDPLTQSYFPDSTNYLIASCYVTSGSSGPCDKPHFWDPRQTLFVDLTPQRVVIRALAVRPYDTPPPPLPDPPDSGNGFDVFEGDLLTVIELGIEGGEGQTYRVYLAEVPEPATWMLLIGGFGLAGAALRHRRSSDPLSLG